MKKVILLVVSICFLGLQIFAQNCNPDFTIKMKSSKEVTLYGFIKDSVQGPVTYTWYPDFDNSQITLSGQSINYIYTANGTYKILLSINNNNQCFDTIGKYITIYENMAPVAVMDKFSITQEATTQFYYPLKNDFDKDGGIDVNSLKFVQLPKFGSVEIIAPGKIRYTKGGNYRGADTIKYTVKDMEGKESEAGFIYIQTQSPNECVAKFRFEKDTSGNTIYFINQSSPNLTYFSWNFGDNSYSSLKNPVHTYAKAGVYLVSLTGTDSMQTCTKTFKDTIKVGHNEGPICDVNFKFDYLEGGYGVKFTPLTSANIRNYYWDFGDGKQSNLKDPKHYYEKAGTYTVCLIGTDSLGKCESKKCMQVNVGQNNNPCVAKFQFKKDANDPFLVLFFNNSYGDSLNYFWNFGDSSFSEDKNPSHKFLREGIYEVCLTISNSNCEATYCTKVFVGKEKASISGIVYLDENGNGKRDDGEKGLEDQHILIDPIHKKVLTTKGGFYKTILDSGSYTVSLLLAQGWEQTQPVQPSTYTIEVMKSGRTEGLNFGIKPINKTQDLKIKITSFKKKEQNGKPLRYQILYKNVGSNIMSGNVILNYDSRLIFKKSDSSNYIHNDSLKAIKWIFKGLKSGEYRRIHVGFEYSEFALEGDTLLSVAVVNPMDNDATPNNNTSNVCTIVGGNVNHQEMDDVDCDEKDGHKKGLNQYNAIPYTIRFQNLGSSTVQKVIIMDTLDAGIDPSSIVLKDMSHDFKMELSNENILKFEIENINLPSYIQDEVGSQGFISFYLTPNGKQQSVSNQAFIYFDANEALATNKTSSPVELSSGIVKQLTSNLNVSIYPNPFSNSATLKIANARDLKYEFQMVDMNGRVVKTIISNTSTDASIQKEGLSAGIYFYQVITENGDVTNGKIIVQ